MMCDTCKKTVSCTELCEDMEEFLPKEMRFEEIPMGGAGEMDNLIQHYIDDNSGETIERDINPDLFKVGIETLNKLKLRQHVILYLYHVAGLTDAKIAFFFNISRLKVHRLRKSTYTQLRRMVDENTKGTMSV